jgi:hypothetical protein
MKTDQGKEGYMQSMNSYRLTFLTKFCDQEFKSWATPIQVAQTI